LRRGGQAVPRPRQPRTSRVQTPVDIFLDGFPLPFDAFGFRPTDAFDSHLTVEFPIEVLREYQVLSKVFETPFEGSLKNL